MFEEYQKLCGHYLRLCIEYKPKEGSTKEEYLKSCTFCERIRQQLIGMIDLICVCGEITDVQRNAEIKDIVETFSTRELYHAYVESGEVMVYKL